MSRVILLIDDEPATALELALSALAPVKVFRSAEAALRFLDKNSGVAAVVTDLELPRMDGFALISRIRSTPEHKTTPIIVVSGSAEPGAAERALALGAGAFYSKPCSPAELRRRLEGLMHETPECQ